VVNIALVDALGQLIQFAQLVLLVLLGNIKRRPVVQLPILFALPAVAAQLVNITLVDVQEQATLFA
jgi:hypothetical protein